MRFFWLLALLPSLAWAEDRGFVISHTPSRLPAPGDMDLAMWMPVIVISLGFVVAAKVLLGKPVSKIKEDKTDLPL